MARDQETSGGLAGINESDYGVAAGQDAELDEFQQFLDKLREQKEEATRGEQSVQAERISGARDMQYRPAVGNFMFPREQTWAAHRELILDEQLNLGFSPKQYSGFDNVLHQKVRLRGFYDRKEVRYAKYDVARENLAIVRNYLLNEFFRDGKVDDNDYDRGKLKQLRAIAEDLTEGFNNDTVPRNPLKFHVSMARANKPGEGAQYLYKKIMERQQDRNWLTPLWELLGQETRDWGLPGLENSPFSDAALLRPPPAHGIDAALTDEEIEEAAAMFARSQIGIGDPIPDTVDQSVEQLNHIADSFVEASLMAMSVEELAQPTKREAIEEAKNILDKLKLKIGSAFISHGLEQFGDMGMKVLGDLKTLVDTYTVNLNKLAGLDANIYENPAVEAANKALGKLSYMAKTETLIRAYRQGDSRIAAKVEGELSAMPDMWKPKDGETFEGVLSDLESGLKTVVLRMNQMASQDHTAESWLGFTNQNTLGGHTPNTPGNNAAQQADAMKNDDFYRQLNAQRAQRAKQAAMRYASRMQQGHADGHHHAAPAQSMESALKGTDLASMRNAMKTSKNAAPVQTGNKANLQAITQRDMAQRAGRMQTIEAVRRANQRSQKMREGDHDEVIHPPSAPHHKKDDHGHER
jgi:hypothetical protein